MDIPEDVDDILDDIESQEIRIKAAQKGAGDRKRSALMTIGGAVAGSVLGDIFIGREYVLEGDLLEGYTSIYGPGTEEHFYVEASGTDRGGILEDFGLINMNDQFAYSDNYEVITHYDGYSITEHDIFSETYTEGQLESFNFIQNSIDEGILTESAAPYGAGVGGSLGAGAGYGSERVKRKLDAKRELNKKEG